MPKKREPSEDEIDALTESFRGLWRSSDVMRPWLRKHRQMVLDLVHDDWSWAAMAKVLSKAGIKYRNGEACDWHAEGLRREFVKAAAPLKRNAERKKRKGLVDGSEGSGGFEENANGVVGVSSITSHDERFASDFTPEELDEPEFQLASFVDWEKERMGAPGIQNDRSKPSRPAGSQRYEEIMAQLTRKNSSC